PAASAGDLVGPELPVRCEAVEMGEGYRYSADWGHEYLPPRLVVLGKVTGGNVPKGGGEPTTRIEVGKGLAGIWREKTLEFHGWWFADDKKGRAIFALAPSTEDGVEWRICHALPVEEEKAALAIASARLDYFGLSACCLFVGKEIAAAGNGYRTVE